MHSLKPLVLMGLLVALLASACVRPQAPGQSGAREAERPGLAPPKRVIAAIRGVPASLSQQKTQRSVGGVPGLDAIEELVHAGLTHLNNQGTRIPQLAESTPTAENGLWKVFPDGRMETSWKIRRDARWQDGAPVTSEDLLFTARVEQDPELAIPRYPVYDLIEAIEALDVQTILVKWKQPYIEADAMFSYAVGLPLPKHLLEEAFVTGKASFLGLPYWTKDFIGAGAYRVDEWATDSHVVLRANDTYVLGRPKINEIEVRFFPDAVTLLANILAGVELSIGRGVSAEEGLLLRDQWRDGTTALTYSNWTPINPQFINTNPPIVTDLRFRRALLHAIDRQQMVDTIMAGQTTIAHSYVSPQQAAYQWVEGSIVRYAYEPRRAVQMIEELGYMRGVDRFFADRSNQKLSVSIYTNSLNAVQVPATAAVANFWQEIGVAVEQNIASPQLAQDREFRAQFPAFELAGTRTSLTPADIQRFHSAATPLPENQFRVTGNQSRYRNPELDALIDRYVTTIPIEPRMQALAGMVHHQTENLTVMGLFYNVQVTAIAHRLTNVGGRGEGFTEAWNVEDWEAS